MNKWFSQIVNELNEEVIKEYNSIEDFPENTYGFVYIVTHIPTGKAYVGKKVLQHNLTKKLTKKELAEQTGPGRRSVSKKVQKESDWKTYWGSSKELLTDVKQLKDEHFECIILQLCKTKKELTYYEMHYQCVNECITCSTHHSYNDNVLGKFFRKDFVTQA